MEVEAAAAEDGMAAAVAAPLPVRVQLHYPGSSADAGTQTMQL
jgi:hypothetical protein